jgi:Type IV secretion system pilin
MKLSSLLAGQLINIRDTSGPYANLYGLRPSAYVRTGINLLLGAAGVLAFIFLLLGGVQWITAGGDKDALDKARKRVTQAVIGLAVVFSVYALLYIVQVLFGVNLIQFVINNIQ